MTAKAREDAWFPNLVRGRCVECDWSGPVHDTYMTTGATLVRLEVREHNIEQHADEGWSW